MPKFIFSLNQHSWGKLGALTHLGSGPILSGAKLGLARKFLNSVKIIPGTGFQESGPQGDFRPPDYRVSKFPVSRPGMGSLLLGVKGARSLAGRHLGNRGPAGLELRPVGGSSGIFGRVEIGYCGPSAGLPLRVGVHLAPGRGAVRNWGEG